MVALAVMPSCVAVQVWVPVSLERTAARLTELVVAVWKGQLLQVDDHW